MVMIQANLALENFQIAGMALVKISLLLYYSRIFISKPFLLAANILIAITSLLALSIILVSASCPSIHLHWLIHSR